MAKTPNLSRSDFVKAVTAVLGTLMGAIVGLPAIGYVLSPALKSNPIEGWIPLGRLEDYPLGVPSPFSFTRTKVNGWERTTNSYGVFVYRSSDVDVTVFSNVCTHLACRVNWSEDRQLYLCPCHDAEFDIQGNVVGGPPKFPLTTYEARVEDGNLSIYLKGG